MKDRDLMAPDTVPTTMTQLSLRIASRFLASDAIRALIAERAARCGDVEISSARDRPARTLRRSVSMARLSPPTANLRRI
jgi:hypothetical protein